MSIDLSQFIPTFLEESFDGLQAMESALLGLDASDDEAINTIFRAAHSIKGGAGTFGFSALADFTHVVETLLDGMRCGTVAVTEENINLLLSATDSMRLLLAASKDGDTDSVEGISELQQKLQQALTQSADIVAEEIPQISAAADPLLEKSAGSDAYCWEILFEPDPEILRTGNDPRWMFSALKELGPLSVESNLTELPILEQLDPQQLRLSWKLTLNSDCEESEIKEVFEWVEDECKLSIYRVNTAEQAEKSTIPVGWNIEFIPDETILHTGNDPLFLFRSLAELGALQVAVNEKILPSLGLLTAQNLYVTWQLVLLSDCQEAEIRDVFEWVEDQCVLHISPLSTQMEGDEPEPIAVNDDTVNGVASSYIEESAIEQVPPQAEASDVSLAEPKPIVSIPRPMATKAASETSSIRVDTEKVDALIDRVGELVITQAMLAKVGEDLSDVDHSALERLSEGLGQLERNTRDLQEDVMRIRMMPISFVFNRFPRVVHDVSSALGKKIELVLIGEQTELDKTVMEKIGDPLVHLLRNSLDHGIEGPEERVAQGKAETGEVKLNAFHQGGYIVIEISDDGRGLNSKRIHEKAIEVGLVEASQDLSEQEVHDLIFHPGFSTADQVSDLSGRGVGMDVVKRNIESLGGRVSVRSQEGLGAIFSVRLPLTLAILDGQLVSLAGDIYVVPLVSIVETVLVREELLKPIAGQACLLRFRDEYIPLLTLVDLFHLPVAKDSPVAPIVVIVEDAGQKIGLIVDELLGQQQTVIKSLETNFKRVEGLSGATILGDGSVALILDVAGVVSRSQQFENHAKLALTKNVEECA